VSAPADADVSSPPLDSSRLSKAFSAALGAVNVESAAGEAEIDVGEVPAPAEGAVAGIPGVNLGAPSSTSGGGTRA